MEAEKENKIDLGNGIVIDDPDVMQGKETPFEMMNKPIIKKDDENTETQIKDENPIIENEDKNKEDNKGSDDRLKFINEILGDKFDSVETFTNTYKEKLSKLEQIEKINQELEQRVKTTVNPLKDYPELAKAMSWMKETNSDLKTFMKVQSMNLDDVNHLNIMVDDFLLKNPNENREDVKEMLEKKYKLTKDYYRDLYDEDEFETKEVQEKIEKEIRLNRLSLVNDATPIIDRLKELKSKGEVPDFEAMSKEQEAKLQIEKEQNQTQWRNIVDEMIKGFTTYKDYKKGEKEPFIEFEVNEKQREQLKTMLTNYVETLNVKPDKKTVQNLGNQLYNAFESINRVALYEAYAQQKVNERDKMWAERTGTSLADEKKEVNVPNEVKDDVQKHNESVDNEIAKFYGLA